MKNKLMRAATLLLVLTLMTSCFVGSTFAKYTTSATSDDTARVAYWGFKDTSLNIDDLFADAYILQPADTNQTVVSAVVDADVIAPGTENTVTFKFDYTANANAAKPEVDYNFTVSTDGSSCATDIQNNKNIIWYLDDAKAGTNGTWTELMAAIEDLAGAGHTDGTKKYEAGTLPDAFDGSDVHKIKWEWLFDANGDVGVYNRDSDPDLETTQNQYDTMMANKVTLDQVYLKITITATQVD